MTREEELSIRILELFDTNKRVQLASIQQDIELSTVQSSRVIEWLRIEGYITAHIRFNAHDGFERFDTGELYLKQLQGKREQEKNELDRQNRLNNLEEQIKIAQLDKFKYDKLAFYIALFAFLFSVAIAIYNIESNSSTKSELQELKGRLNKLESASSSQKINDQKSGH